MQTVMSKVVVPKKSTSSTPKRGLSATSTPKRDTVAEAMDLSIFVDEDLTNFLLNDSSVVIPDWELPIIPEPAVEKRPTALFSTNSSSGSTFKV